MVSYRHFGTNFQPLLQESSSLNSILELLDPLNMWPIRCPETSVNNYHSNMRNISEERTFLKSLPFWNVTRCRLVVGYRLFRTNYRSLHEEPSSLGRTWNAWLLFFYVSLTLHLSITLANDQLDAQIFNTFITILYMYMFRAISCSSSGGQIVLIHLVSPLSVSDRPVHRTVTYWEWRYQMLY